MTVTARARSSRWATDVGASKPTITYDLGQTRTIGGVVIYWEKSSASNYFVETSADGEKLESTERTIIKRFRRTMAGGED